MTLAIVPLAGTHRRGEFECGEPALDEFLKRYARQQRSRDFSRTYVAADQEDAVLGFVTVSVGQVRADDFPADVKLPRYPVPVFRIGRLAVDRRQQGRDLSRELMRFALRLALETSGRVGVHAVVVDAKNEAAAFYARLGFRAFAQHPLSMFLPVATLRSATAGD
jgi:predicted N-acetyltransferase YhbS